MEILSRSRILIVTGMHRCGTSFISNWMIESGLFMGHRLAGATPSNVKGHFEDVDFLELHEIILKHNDRTMYLSEDVRLEYTDNHKKLAQSFCIDRNQTFGEWGFKQPRAALMLDLWKEIIPDAHYIYAVRKPLNVVNSIIRRESNKLLQRNTLEIGTQLNQEYLSDLQELSKRYCDMYALHCKKVVEFVGEFPETKFLTLEFDRLYDNVEVFQKKLNDWGFSIELIDYKTLFDETLLIQEKEHFVSDELISDDAKYWYNEILRLNLI